MSLFCKAVNAAYQSMPVILPRAQKGIQCASATIHQTFPCLHTPSFSNGVYSVVSKRNPFFITYPNNKCAEPLFCNSRSFNTQTRQVQDITSTSKWKLAQRISGHAAAPEEALRDVFTRTMQQVERTAKTQFAASIKDRVWNKISGDKLKPIKEALISEFCDTILGCFNEQEATAMLEQHTRTGAVKGKPSISIQLGYWFYKESILDVVVEKTISVTQNLLPEIVNALRSEGVELPEPKSLNTSQPTMSTEVVTKKR